MLHSKGWRIFRMNEMSCMMSEEVLWLFLWQYCSGTKAWISGKTRKPGMRTVKRSWHGKSSTGPSRPTRCSSYGEHVFHQCVAEQISWEYRCTQNTVDTYIVIYIYQNLIQTRVDKYYSDRNCSLTLGHYLPRKWRLTQCCLWAS